MTRVKSNLVGRAILIEHPDASEQLLVVEIDIDCPGCGTYSLKLAGHHLRGVRKMLDEFIALHPTLTGDESGIEVLNRFNLKGRPPSDPSVN
jgi:hypothetical protein